MSENEQIPHFQPGSADWTPFPEYGGEYNVIYRSDDGRRVAGSFKEAGQHHLVMPYDEFIYLIAGEARITVEGIGEIHMRPGDACWLKEGWVVDFDLSEDFHDVTVLVADHTIDF